MARLWLLVAVLVGLLAACGELEIAFEEGVTPEVALATSGVTSTVTASPTRAPSSATPTATRAARTPVVTETGTATATSSPTANTLTATRQPPPPTRVVPSATPTLTPTPTPTPPLILHFDLLENGTTLDGRRLIFSWQARGTSATLVGHTRPQAAPTWSLPLSGTETLVLEETLYRNPFFVLTIAEESVTPARVVSATVTVPWPCVHTYFFADPPALCAQAPPQQVEAAFQPFEHGRMVWLSHEDDVLVFFDDDHTWQWFDDPSQEGQPLPAPTPPPGYYQPVRGFGAIWANHEAVRNRLGWGLEEEQGYTANLQEQAGVGARTTHFLELGDGAIISLVREGGAPTSWQFVAGSAMACEDTTEEAPAITSAYAAAMSGAAIEGVAGDSANFFGRRCRDGWGNVTFTPAEVWFWVTITAPDLDYELVGQRFAAYLDLMAATFEFASLPGTVRLYGTMSTTAIGDGGEPLSWTQYLSHSLIDFLAARNEGLTGRALLEATGLLSATRSLSASDLALIGSVTSPVTALSQRVDKR